MTLIDSLIYLAAIGAIAFVAGRLLPKRLFKARRFPYRPFAFEQNGKIYRRLRIGAWQAKLPDMSRILPGLMPAKRISHRPSDGEIVRMIQETCVAEFVHACLSLLGLGVFQIGGFRQSMIVYALYFLLGNLPFILIQRYNRPRLMHMLASSRRRAEQLRNKRLPDQKRVLVLSCSTGEGHNSCAAAIREGFEAQHIRCDVTDGLAFVSKSFSALMSGGHVWMYRHLPILFRYGYRYSEQHPELFQGRSFFCRLLACGAEPLYSFLLEGGYDAVICPHVFTAMMLSEMLRRHPMEIRTAFCATDYTLYPLTEQGALDLCFVPDRSLAETYAAGGITAERIVASGIPVRQAVYHHADKAFARRSLDLPVDGKHLLVMCGSMGCGPLRRLVSQLAEEMDANQFMTVVCGTNRRLKSALQKRFCDRERIRILGYTDRISLLMDSADLYLTKPGGMSVTEAAVKQLPMVMINAVAGCEDYNKQFFLELGLGVTAETPEELAKLCLELLRDERRLQRMKQNGSRLRIEHAAQIICAELKAAPNRKNP